MRGLDMGSLSNILAQLELAHASVDIRNRYHLECCISDTPFCENFRNICKGELKLL